MTYSPLCESVQNALWLIIVDYYYYRKWH